MAPVKKTPAKAEPAKEIAYSSYVQFGESTYDVNDIITRAEKAFKNDNKRKRYEEFRVYIKPEDAKAYYVAKLGDKEYRDSIDL